MRTNKLGYHDIKFSLVDVIYVTALLKSEVGNTILVHVSRNRRVEP
jgi:hypothetical protein